MARAGGLHPFGVAVLLAGAFLPITDGRRRSVLNQHARGSA
jgi:hypothetical protein